jgi:hypothetical protein
MAADPSESWTHVPTGNGATFFENTETIEKSKFVPEPLCTYSTASAGKTPFL